MVQHAISKTGFHDFKISQRLMYIGVDSRSQRSQLRTYTAIFMYYNVLNVYMNTFNILRYWTVY